MTSKFEKRWMKASKPHVIDEYFSDAFVEDLPVEKLKEFQEKSLKEIITLAYNKSHFYKEKMNQAGVKPEDIQTLEDLKHLPFLDKDELRGKPWALLTCDKEDICLVQVSTGTTGGQEIYMMYTWGDYYLNELTPGYPTLFPIEKGDICFNSLPYEMSSAGLAFHKTFLDGIHATVVPAGKGGAYSTPEKTIRMMRDLQPTILITTPSWAMLLAEAAEEASIDIKSLPLKKIWLTGEGCSSAFRDRVEEIWGTSANFYYGSLEIGAIGVECDAHDGYHLSMAHAMVEIVNPDTGEVLEPGEVGEIVVSVPVRYDSPVLRYRTRDIGYIEVEECSCGVKLPRIFLRGRLVDQIEMGGQSLSPYYIEEHLMQNPEVGNWFQFVVKTGSDSLIVRCELSKGFEPSEQLAESLESKLEYALGIPFKFEFVDQIERPKGKTIRVIHED
jgi:phenylacetate-CoA ligase